MKAGAEDLPEPGRQEASAAAAAAQTGGAAATPTVRQVQWQSEADLPSRRNKRKFDEAVAALPQGE